MERVSDNIPFHCSRFKSAAACVSPSLLSSQQVQPAHSRRNQSCTLEALQRAPDGDQGSNCLPEDLLHDSRSRVLVSAWLQSSCRPMRIAMMMASVISRAARNFDFLRRQRRGEWPETHSHDNDTNDAHHLPVSPTPFNAPWIMQKMTINQERSWVHWILGFRAFRR